MLLVGMHGGRCTTSPSEQVGPSENTMRPSLNSTQYSLPSFITRRTSLRGPSSTLISLPYFFASSIARQTLSDVAGMATSLTPSGASASMMAFITTGMAPTVPASPAPLAPSGLYLVGTGFDLISMLGTMSARGMV